MSNTRNKVQQLISAAELQYGLPSGTMSSVMQQEIGGNSKYLDDPSAYHYGLNAEGKRVAPKSGKVSTAFGPFGILESTAKDPGYGVRPLKDKSLEEQARFAAEYLAARTRASGGDLASGLAGYGEGAKYSNQVMGRMGGARALPVAQVAAAQEMGPVQETPVVTSQGIPLPPELLAEMARQPTAVTQQASPWQAFLKAMPGGGSAAPVQSEDFQFGGSKTPTFNVGTVSSLRPDFRAFGNWGGKKV